MSSDNPSGEPSFVAVGDVGELAPDTVREVRVGDRSILLCNSEGSIFAIENLCSHVGEPLACGRVRRGWIACPAHGSRFDLATGEPLTPPATTPIATFPVRVVGTTIEVAA